MKKYLLYLWTVFKSHTDLLPRLGLSCIALFGLALVLGFISNELLSSSSNRSPLKVAVVMPDDSDKLDTAFELVSSMESLRELCDFELLENLDEALEGLDRKEYVAIAMIPTNFLHSLVTGENKAATIIIPDNPGSESAFFLSVISSGARTFSYVQAGIYTVSDFLNANGHPEAVADGESAMNNLYIRYVLSRGAVFKAQYVNATGSTDTTRFFFVSGILLILVFSSLCFIPRYSQKSRDHLDALRIKGIPGGYILFCEYICNTLLLFIISLLLYIPSSMILLGNINENLAVAVLGAFLVCACISAFTMMLSRIADSGLAATSILFLLGLLMLYACGRIFPSAYLPPIAQNIGMFLPVFYWSELLEGMFSGNIYVLPILITLGTLFVFYILGWLVGNLRQKGEAHR